MGWINTWRFFPAEIFINPLSSTSLSPILVISSSIVMSFIRHPPPIISRLASLFDLVRPDLVNSLKAGTVSSSSYLWI